MLRNFLTVALRNIWRNKVFSLINVAGLAIGISASLVIFLIVDYEFSFEKFQKDRDRIFRIVSVMHFPDQEFKNSGSCLPLIPMVRQSIPAIEQSTTFWNQGQANVSIPSLTVGKNKFHKEDKIIWADDQYFRFFHYNWIAGNSENALNAPNKVVLTESRAKSYFPNTSLNDMLGKIIVYDDTVQTMVTGIVRDLDQITDFTFKEFISYKTYESYILKKRGNGDWGSISSASQFFIKLRQGTDAKTVEKQVQAERKKVEKNAYLSTTNHLQALSDIHFSQDYDNFDQRLASKKTLYGLVAVAGFLLLLACINFVNLTTAQSANRSREIGIRKTLGSSASQLIAQFLGETFVLTVLATCLSIALIPILLKIFSDFIPQGMKFDFATRPEVVAFSVLLLILVSFLSGFYPALVLSRFKPVLVLKNIGNSGEGRKAWLRKALTFSQFVIAQFFIMATLVVAKQIRYSMNMDMGFNKEAILYLDIPYTYKDADKRAKILYNQLLSVPGIRMVSIGGEPPASGNTNMSTMKFKKDGKDIETTVEIKSADTNYIILYHLQLLAGRNLQQSDTAREYLANETYARFLGFRNPADIIGKLLERGNGIKLPIIGLVRDFHTKSSTDQIKPLVIATDGEFDCIHILLERKGQNTEGWKRTIAEIGNRWKSIYPEEEYKYNFFDESIAKFYEGEQKMARLLNWSSALAIFISSLGLLGLVIHTTSQRTKEIGVRKVLGASVSQITALLSRDFLKLVILAFVIASPLAWWVMNHWLENYAYKTTISWWVFILTCVSMLVIAAMTMGIQTIRSARENPVKSLRSE